jgi:hypothetical protein
MCESIINAYIQSSTANAASAHVASELLLYTPYTVNADLILTRPGAKSGMMEWTQPSLFKNGLYVARMVMNHQSKTSQNPLNLNRPDVVLTGNTEYQEIPVEWFY